MSQYGYIVHSELYHHGIKGQKWGIRRYQNKDGTLTAEGKAKYYNEDGSLSKIGKKIEVRNWKKGLKTEIKSYGSKKKENRQKYKAGDISKETYKKNKKKLHVQQYNLNKDYDVAKAHFVTKDQKLKLRDMKNNTKGRLQYRTLLTLQDIGANLLVGEAVKETARFAVKKAVNGLAQNTYDSYNAYSYANNQAKAEGFENWKDKRTKLKTAKYGSFREIDD